jgi:hypothetical protein
MKYKKSPMNVPEWWMFFIFIFRYLFINEQLTITHKQLKFGYFRIYQIKFSE